jgi:6-phosphofructokinase 2
MSILTITLNPTIDISSDVDKIMPTHKMRTFNQRRHAGGGGVNVARVVTELGGAAELLFLSGGATGALLEDTLNDLAIPCHVVKIDGSTRIAFMVHETNSGLEYRFVPEGPEIDEANLADTLRAVEAFRGTFIVASGSLPLGAPDDTYARMAEIARNNAIRFILDTSGTALKQTLERSHVFLVKPSKGELEKLVGRTLADGDIGEAAMQLVRSGKAENVAVTMGGDGALLASAEGVMRLPARKVVVRSAVGAGDSFVGAMVWALAEGLPLADAFRYGTAAGAAAVLTPGTELCLSTDVMTFFQDTPMPSLSDI